MCFLKQFPQYYTSFPPAFLSQGQSLGRTRRMTSSLWAKLEIPEEEFQAASVNTTLVWSDQDGL